jgi:hypothetical protein
MLDLTWLMMERRKSITQSTLTMNRSSTIKRLCVLGLREGSVTDGQLRMCVPEVRKVGAFCLQKMKEECTVRELTTQH